MKKFIQALIGSALVVTVMTGTPGTAQAAESPKPKVTEVVGKLKTQPVAGKPKATPLTKYSKHTSLGKEARKRLGHSGTCLRLDRHTIACYIGTTKLKYAGTAKKKPKRGVEQVVVRSSIKKNRFHVYRFNHRAK